MRRRTKSQSFIEEHSKRIITLLSFVGDVVDHLWKKQQIYLIVRLLFIAEIKG